MLLSAVSVAHGEPSVNIPVSFPSLHLTMQTLHISQHHKKGEHSAIRYIEREEDHIHITFITVHCYIIVTVNLLLCLIYKLNFVTDMYIQEKIQYVQGLALFVVSDAHWGSRTCPLQIRGESLVNQPNDFTSELIQTFKEELSSSLKIFPKIEEEGYFQIHFMRLGLT